MGTKSAISNSSVDISLVSMTPTGGVPSSRVILINHCVIMCPLPGETGCENNRGPAGQQRTGAGGRGGHHRRPMWMEEKKRRAGSIPHTLNENNYVGLFIYIKAGYLYHAGLRVKGLNNGRGSREDQLVHTHTKLMEEERS